MVKFVFDSKRRHSGRGISRPASQIIVLLVCTQFFAAQAFGQPSGPPPARFGFSAGFVFQDLNIGTLSTGPDGPRVGPAGIGTGAELGLWGQWELLPALYVRPALQFSYTTNAARFWAEDGHVNHQTYTFADLEVPVHLSLVSPFNRLKAKGIFLAGARLSWNAASAPRDAAFHLLPERLGLDLGLGMAFGWHGWAVQPEFVYSYGLNNLHAFDNHPADRTIRRIVRDRLCFRILLTPR